MSPGSLRRRCRLAIRTDLATQPAVIDRSHPGGERGRRSLPKGISATRRCFCVRAEAFRWSICSRRSSRIPTVLMGFALPDDRLHAPNEKFHLPTFFNGIATSIHFLTELARIGSARSAATVTRHFRCAPTIDEAAP